MTLDPTTRLGPYEIVAPLGAGGMGEVYRAKDTRLGREVAIKVLPAEVAGDPERLRRFEQEAKAVSALNHPHIITLYEVGESPSGPYLVLEKIEGHSLRELLRDGALPAKRVLQLGAQIAEGLAKAHAAGIVHRDLKPENVMVTDDGFAKILDFGLARLVYPEIEGGAPRDMTTLAEKTASGMILGTLGYLSPEQAMGKPADFRSDQFALGALLYELATGERPFHRETTPESLTAVIREEPEPLRTKNAALPPQLGWIVERCLSKDPNDRYASTRDLARDLADLRDRLSDLSRPAAAGEPIAPAVPRRIRGWLPWSLAALGLLAGAAGAWLAAHRPAAREEPTTRFTVVPVKPGVIDGYPALSPDGRRMAYVLLDPAGSDTLWIHDFSTGEARVLEGTEGAQEPFWSPDGQFVAFFAHSELRRVAVAGGAPLTICPAIDPHGGSWGAHGVILFNPGGQATIYRVAASGGSPVPVFEADPSQGAATLRYPWFLPDGDHFLYTAIGNAERTGVYWSSLQSHGGKQLLRGFTRAAFDPRGYLLFARDGALLSQRFDPARGELSGEAMVVAEHVDQNPQKLGEAYFDVSPGGTLAVRAASARPNQLVWFDRAGKRLALVASQGQFMEPSLSPDGSRVLVGVPTGPASGDIWAFDTTSTDRSSRLTFGEVAVSPVWSPDGTRILYSTPAKSGMRLLAQSTSGSGAAETILESSFFDFADEWSRDGRYVLFERTSSTTGIDLWLLPTTGARKPTPYLQTPANETHASLSPDGRYIAYVSDESGSPQIYVQTVPTSVSKWQISTAGGDEPLWSIDGKELYYLGLDRMLTAVPLRSLAPFEPGPSLPLFRLPIPALAPTGPRAVYAISRDRQRVLVNALASQPDEPGIRVTLNWKPGAAGS